MHRLPDQDILLIAGFPYIEQVPITGDVRVDAANLYLANGKTHTAAHVRNVAVIIAGIAAAYGLDPQACELGAYCHDIAAIIRPEDMLQCALARGMELDPAEQKYPFLLHQRFSALAARDVFGIADERIISAVGHHTTLKAGPSDHDLALFLADKIAWDQPGAPPYLEIVQRELSRSLCHAALAYIQFVLDHGLILCPHRWLAEAHEWLSDRCAAGHSRPGHPTLANNMGEK
jgi:HD superfamily phosphohydrolase YqeK